MKIAFIGGGKMAAALIAGLAKSVKVIVSDVDPKRLRLLKSKYKIKAAKSNAEAFAAADIVVLAVKPQQMAEVLQGVGDSGIGSRGKKHVISIAAGIPISYLQKKLPGAMIIRTMPNNPALVGQGITAIAKGIRVTRFALRVTKRIFSSVGEVVEVPEKWLDAVTGLSGSGPAYVYKFIEALTTAGVKVGLPRKLAARLAQQTVLGAAVTVKQSRQDPAQLRAMVTSPGGTTLAGLAALERRAFSRAVGAAVAAAAKRAKVLNKQWAV